LPPTAAGKSSAAGGIAAGVILSAGAAGLFVYAKFFGGAPVLSKLASDAAAGAQGLVNKLVAVKHSSTRFSASGGERASLLKTPAAPSTVSASAAAERFKGVSSV
jgi:hypothetical protein